MTRRVPETDRLPEPAEALLEGWPAPTRSALGWEDAGSATMARVRETEAGSTPDELLAPPFPAGDGEASFDLDVPADQPRLADIARRAVPSSAPDARALAREGLLAAEESRARSVNAPPRPPSGASVPPAAVEARHAAGGPSGPVALSAPHAVAARSELPRSELPRSEPLRRESERTGSSRGSLAGIYLGGAALAVAAAALILVIVRQPELGAPPLGGLASAEQATRPAAQTAAPLPAAAAPAFRSLEDLPTPPTEERLGGQPSESSRKSSALSRGAGEPSQGESLPFRVEPSPKSQVVLAARNDDEVGERPKAAAGGRKDGNAREVDEPSPAQEAAPASPVGEPEAEGALPDQPTVGAIQAAVGAVMGGARSCLAGQDQGSKAQVTFGRSGRVQSVTVSGPAAGTPAESCLRSALSAARVEPFSNASFTASLTVRPP